MNEDTEEPVGPFITVVSVDGGLQCGNKLTVITPTEINDGDKRSNDNYSPYPIQSQELATRSGETTLFGKVKASGIPTLAGMERLVGGTSVLPHQSKHEKHDAFPSSSSYVTVVAMADQSNKEATPKGATKTGIPMAKPRKSQQGNISSTAQLGSKFYSNQSMSEVVKSSTNSKEQIVTIRHKLSRQNTDLSKTEVKQLNQIIDNQGKVIEEILILRLPGEKLGFGLRFEGGVANPSDKIRHLFIQSCAVNSPSIKAKTSWGHLRESDEIIEIDSVPVNTLTRMECIHKLKDSSVAVRLLVAHTFSNEEIFLLKGQSEESTPQEDKSTGKMDKGMTGRKLKREEGSNKSFSNDTCVSPLHPNSADANDPDQPIMLIGETVSSSTSLNLQNANSKIPVPKPKPNQGSTYDDSTSTKCANNHVSSAKSSPIVYDINENEITRKRDRASHQTHGEDGNTASQDLQAETPAGSSDELVSHELESDREKAAENFHFSSNNLFQQPVEAQFYLNTLSHNHRPSSVSLEHYSMESDETGSSRSTVVSRLSMASSITSMPAITGLPSDNSATNLFAANGAVHNNGHNHHHHVMLAKRKSSNSLNAWPEGEALVNAETNVLQSKKIALREGMFESAIGDGHSKEVFWPSLSEVPLAPPLFFQDDGRVTPVLVNEQNISHCNHLQKMGQNELVAANTNSGFVKEGPFTITNDDPSYKCLREKNVVNDAKVDPPMVSSSQSTFASYKYKSKGEGKASQFDDPSLNIDGSTNWEQKGILDFDDDDDLALLAEELGLDQEDEDLFNSLVAEIDEANAEARDLVTYQRGGVDELIHRNFNGFPSQCGFNTREIADSQKAIEKQNYCATSPFNKEEGNVIRDAKFATDESKQKMPDCHAATKGVVEPINSQIIMTINNGREEEQPESMPHFVQIVSQDLEESLSHVISTKQPPAPPPRMKVSGKKKKEAGNLLDLHDGIGSHTETGTVNTDEFRSPEKIVTTRSNLISLEIRLQSRPNLIYGEAGEINSEILAASASSKDNSDDSKVVLCDGDESRSFDDSSRSEENVVVSQSTVATAEQGSSSAGDSEEAITISSTTMEGSTDLLHPHQFSPPTFSRLPPDGHEFPNACWSDENLQHTRGRKTLMRSECSVDSNKSSDPGSPPPLPTSEPPKEDILEAPSLPPVPPPKRLATRKLSVEERKKLFENSASTESIQPIMPQRTTNEEPSKKSVKDKIAMFSTRSSSEESTEVVCPKPVFKTSSLSRNSSIDGTMNGVSKSSENLLKGFGGRKGSVDLSIPNGTGKSVNTGYGTLTRISVTPNSAGNYMSGKSLYERSQSMVDVAGNKSATTNNLGRPASSMMEQRRKCITKLRGLVIPDGPSKPVETNGKTSASVIDLPTIISKDAVTLPYTKVPLIPPSSSRENSMFKPSLARTESLDRFSSITPDRFNNNNSNQQPSAKTNGEIEPNLNAFPNVLPKYSPAFKRRGLSAYQSSLSSSVLPLKATSTITNSSYKSTSGTTTTSDTSLRKEKEQVKNKVATNGKSGKQEDSDNDSAVSSSRSSISHGLSPSSSPTPGQSTAATPDPDHDQKQGRDPEQEQVMNMEESWRILKPTSVEAINRKNVLKSAKFSNGGKHDKNNGNGTDDSLSSSNGKHRRSDDEDASYADGETEDTESSCSELEMGGNKKGERMNLVVAGRVNINHGRQNSKPDTEDDDDDTSPKSAVNMEFTELTESPLQAIYDMEVKMAYINEVCDALNERGSSRDLSSARYFSRRDSEATVIERPIEPKRKMSMDAVDNDRRARNRSSSGNESDFSTNSHKPLSRETSGSITGDSERWSLLEKKYSMSMNSVNSLGSRAEPQNQPQGLTPATSVPKIITSASELVEKKIDKIIEKSSTEILQKKTNPNIPRGRNDFKSLAEKWHKIEKSTDSSSTTTFTSTTTKPLSPEKPVVSSHNSSIGSDSLPTTPRSISSQLITSTPLSSSSPSPTKTLASVLESKTSIIERTSTTSTPSDNSNGEMMKTKLQSMETSSSRSWMEKRRSEGEPQRPNSNTANSTKRSVSVNDIRRAFEKAEIARRDDSNAESKDKQDGSGLLIPSPAHFRVSSFDSTTSEESNVATPAGIYGSSTSLVSSAPRDPYGSITSLASSTSLISPQELQQLIDEANQSLEEAGTPSHEVSVLILHREFPGGSLGITLAGGADYETKEITVHKVINGSIADKDGRIQKGDRILSINGRSTKGLTHREALNLLKSPRTEVVLVISRGRSAGNGFQTIDETSPLGRATQPLLSANLVIENDDDTCYTWGPLKTVTLAKDGAGLGFSLEGGKGSIHGDKPLTVKKIFIGGPAEKCGELKVGDLIVSINGINMSLKSRTEAWNFMKKLSDGEVKMCIRSPH